MLNTLVSPFCGYSFDASLSRHTRRLEPKYTVIRDRLITAIEDKLDESVSPVLRNAESIVKWADEGKIAVKRETYRAAKRQISRANANAKALRAWRDYLTDLTVGQFIWLYEVNRNDEFESMLNFIGWGE